MYGIKLDANNDIDLATGNYEIVKDSEQLKDALTAYLRQNRGSWFEDRTRGFPITFGSAAEQFKITPEFLSSYYYTRILSYRDIESVFDYQVSSDTRLRTLSISFSAITSFSAQPVTVTLEI